MLRQRSLQTGSRFRWETQWRKNVYGGNCGSGSCLLKRGNEGSVYIDIPYFFALFGLQTEKNYIKK